MPLFWNRFIPVAPNPSTSARLTACDSRPAAASVSASRSSTVDRWRFGITSTAPVSYCVRFTSDDTSGPRRTNAHSRVPAMYSQKPQLVTAGSVIAIASSSRVLAPALAVLLLPLAAVRVADSHFLHRALVEAACVHAEAV